MGKLTDKLKIKATTTQYTGVSGVAQPAGLGIAYWSENHSDFQLHFDDFDVSV